MTNTKRIVALLEAADAFEAAWKTLHEACTTSGKQFAEAARKAAEAARVEGRK